MYDTYVVYIRYEMLVCLFCVRDNRFLFKGLLPNFYILILSYYWQHFKFEGVLFFVEKSPG